MLKQTLFLNKDNKRETLVLNKYIYKCHLELWVHIDLNDVSILSKTLSFEL